MMMFFKSMYFFKEIFNISKGQKFLLEAIKILELCCNLYPYSTNCKRQLQISKFKIKAT